MMGLDESILEFLDHLGTPHRIPVSVTATEMWINLAVRRDISDKSQNTFTRRMKILYEHGFLEKADVRGSHYYLSEKAQRFLSGDLPMDEMVDDSS